LIGMGIRRLSVTPHAIPELKEIIRTIDVHQGEQIADHALSLELARDVENYLRGELKKICPDHVT
jgi:phosphoenolpyruvate-protein phosphotransferase (PTS system enzyme I)